MEKFDKMGKRIRKDYSTIEKILPLPNLIEVQKLSYNNFLQRDVPVKERKNLGLQSVFNEVFPLLSLKGNIALEYVSYSIGEPKYTVMECKERKMHYGAPLKFTIRIIITDAENPSSKVKEIKEEIKDFHGRLCAIEEKNRGNK